MSKEIADEYASSLADLTVNSKPLINMLTILAEENIDHAGVIVETVEKHLEKVHSDIKLPVLYLVDSIIKNVGGAYAQKFSQSIVNMFTKTFKQVDEKIRSQMFKLRETWHDVFPATKLYQLDVKVNLIDPAWPIQAQPHQSNIHVNPNFLKKPVATTSVPNATPNSEEEKMRTILAKKEQELLMLQRKKIEMELEQTRRQLEMAEKGAKKGTPAVNATMPVGMVNPVVVSPSVPVTAPPPEVATLSVKQRLGPPVNKPSGARIAPVSGALVTARRDPRLTRHAQVAAPLAHTATAAPTAPIAPNVFDIKPLDHVTKRKNVITIDVRPDVPPPPVALRRRDPRLNNKRADRKEKRDAKERKRDEKPNVSEKPSVDPYLVQIPDVKRISKLPPIPKINRDESKNETPSLTKKRKDSPKKKRDHSSGKDSSSGSSPEKRFKSKKVKESKPKEPMQVDQEQTQVPEVVAFKELKNYHKDRYMRRNKEKSESPVNTPEEKEVKPSMENTTSVPEAVVENKDVDLRLLHPAVAEKAAPVTQKRPSSECIEVKTKKNKMEKFDILFGNEDVDLRQLPQVEEVVAPPPPTINDALPKTETNNIEEQKMDTDEPFDSPKNSPKKDWNEVKEKDGSNKKPSKLDLVRAKLAEATKGKDRLGRPLLFSKSPSLERERRRTISSEDVDLRGDGSDLDTEGNKMTISIIMSQAKEQFSDGQLDKSQYNTLMYQVLQLNEKLKLKEAKQRESLEISKRKLKAHLVDDNKVPSPKTSPKERNNFGDIDERVTPSVFLDTPPDSQGVLQDSDMRIKLQETVDGKMPLHPMPPMPVFPNSNVNPFPPPWRGQRGSRNEEFGRRPRGSIPPFYRGNFDKRGIRTPFDPRLPLPHVPPLPTPQMGTCQGESPLMPYKRVSPPVPLGTPNVVLPPTDIRLLEYIDQDPVKTIQIDGIPREIRFYGDTAVIMLDWDDPREIKFLPGSRRVTFDNKDSVVVSFNEGYKQVEIDDQTFDIKFGAPTRELYINGRWFECYFGAAPIGVLIDGKPRLIRLEGPLPQVDIGKTKRTDLCAGKINLIVDATHMCPIFLDSKVQKFMINGNFFTIRFVDALRTVLINEVPFEVEFGGLPKPFFFGNMKHFVRFSVLPRHVKPGSTYIANMEGLTTTSIPPTVSDNASANHAMEIEQDSSRPAKTPSPDGMSQGLDMLASLMPSTMAPSSASEYRSEPFFPTTEGIPGLEMQSQPETNATLPAPLLNPLNVNDLFAKLVAKGIIKTPVEASKEVAKSEQTAQEIKTRDEKNTIHRVDLLKSETLRTKQPGLVAKLYGGMQCSGCGTRFPPEHTVRYSQHLDWHFRQNRRERESARRAHSRHWHYDLADWLQYEELEDLDEREKSWFESGGESTGAPVGEAAEAREEASVAAGAPADHRCALCGDLFHQYYNEDLEEWHLRNAVKHQDENYHPMCLEDYKASLAKKEEPVSDSLEEHLTISSSDKMEESTEPIEIKDVDDLNDDQSDNESVVVVVESEQKENEPVEILEDLDDSQGIEEEEDDVIYKAEPVEQVLVEDDDTDDETSAERAARDQDAVLNFANIKIKQEPIDPDDEPIITAEEDPIVPVVELSATNNTVTSTLDGNVELTAPPAPLPAPIKINITKLPTVAPTLPTLVHQELQDTGDEPLPPGEEPEVEFTVKDTMKDVHFSCQPPVQRGNELSGLCSIM